jgi:restriction system protein
VRDLYGVITSERANKGILITTGSFTPAAARFAEGKQLELIDGAGLAKLLKQFNLGWKQHPE